MSQFVFGTGTLAATSATATTTPQVFGTLQDVTLGFDFTNVPLLGQFQLPVAVGRGAGKVEGSAKFASFSANLFNGIFFNTTPVAGGTQLALSESHAIPTTPYQVTIVPPGSGVFLDDLGVVYSATGLDLQRVASAPVTGQYTCNLVTGLYTFATADTGLMVLITYTYTLAAGGWSSVITNQLMGSAPIMKMTLSNSFNGNNFTIELYQAMSTKLSMGFKNTNWSVPDFSFSCFCNSQNQLGKLSLAVL